jgi:lipopolysaccharide export system permease protein
MRTLYRYATLLFLVQLLFALLGFVSLLQLFDLLNNAPSIMERHGGSLLALGQYALLRLPDIVVVMMPFSVLMACLISLSRLAIHNEVLALKAAGLPYHRLLLAFLPVVLGVSLLHLFTSDQITPAAVRALAAWDEESLERSYRPTQGDRAIWIHDGRIMVRASGVFDGGRRLSGVTIFTRDESGRLVARTTANGARYRDGRWTLLGAEIFIPAEGSGGIYRRASQQEWKTRLSPGHFRERAATPASLSLSDLYRYISTPAKGAFASYYYETTFQKRLAIPASALLMLLLAAPVAQAMRRQGGLATGITIGLGLGFLYFVTDGFSLALGEAGILPPFLAAWSPTLLFGSVGGAALLRMEGY